jgi:hypothetical protein
MLGLHNIVLHVRYAKLNERTTQHESELAGQPAVRDRRHGVLGLVSGGCAGVAFGKAAGWPPAALMALAAIPAATVARQFWAAYRLIAAQDEFVRALTVKRMVVAAGLSITLATAWSVMELTGVPHLPAWLIYPLFWGLYGMVTPLIRDARA